MTKETKQAVAEIVAAVIAIGGLAAITRGVAMAWRPGGWMVAGLFVAAPAVFWLRAQVGNSTKGR